jgi:ParB-like chromosome segregation protein Spo0J
MDTEQKPFNKKAGIANIASRGPGTFKMDPRVIRVRPDEENTRKLDLSDPDQREELDQLKLALLLFGQLQPCGVRYEGGDNVADLVWGFRRWQATMELVAEGKIEPVISVVVVNANDEARRRAINIIENVHVPLNDVELGEGFQALIDRGMSVEKIGEMMPYKGAKIRACLALADSPRAVKEMVRTKAVTTSRAIQAVAEHGDKAVKILEKQVEAAHAAGIKTVKRERKASTNAKMLDQLPLERSDTDARVYEVADEAFRCAYREEVRPGSEMSGALYGHLVALGVALFGADDPKVRSLAAVGADEEAA